MAAQIDVAGIGNGNVFLDDLAGDLTVGTVDTLFGGDTIDGVTATADVCIDVLDGSLTVEEDITAGNDMALRADDDVILGGDAGNTTGAITAGGTAGITATNGNVVDGNAGVNVEATDLVITSGGGIGSDAAGGADDAIETDVTNFAASAAGDVNVIELDTNSQDGLTVTTVTDALKGITATGITAGTDVAVDVLDGDLNINDSITAGNNVALRTQQVAGNSGNGDIIFGDGDGDQVTAGNTASVEAAGDAVDNNGTGVAAIVATDVVFTADDVAAANDVDGFEIEADVVAAQIDVAGIGNGNVLLDDLADDLTVGTVDTLFGGDVIEGVAATVHVCIDVLEGDLNINEDVIAGTEVALRTQDVDGSGDGDVIIGNDNVAVGADADQLIAQDGRVSIDSAGSVVDNNGVGNAAAVATTNVVVAAGGDLGGGLNALFEFESIGLAARTGGGVFIDSLGGDLQLVADETIKGGELINGIEATGEVCIELAGDLVIDGALTGSDVTISAENVALVGDENVTATAPGGTVSVESSGEITDSGNGSFVGENVVLSATGSIGDGSPVTIDATNLAAASETGSVNIQDIDGGVTITTLETLKGGDTVAGITAADEVTLDVIGGNLVINEVISAGTVAAISADGDIANNAAVSAGDTLSVQSGGSLSAGDGGSFSASQVAFIANGDIGSEDDILDIDSDVFAAESSGSIHVNQTSGDLVIGAVTLANGDVIEGVQAANEVCLTVADGGLSNEGQSITAGDEVSIRASGDVVIGGLIEATNADSRISIESTGGSIIDICNDVTIVASEAALRADGNVGDADNGLDTDLDRLGVESVNGSVNINEADGLELADVELSKDGGLVSGASAGEDLVITVEDGDLTGGPVNAGGDVTLTAEQGNLSGGPVSAGGDVTLAAPQGCVEIDADDIQVGGELTILDGKPDDGGFVLPPGVFAQDNVRLGESNFYLDNLYGYLTPEMIQLILDSDEVYDYFDDDDFLLEKHPTGAGQNNDDEENQ